MPTTSCRDRDRRPASRHAAPASNNGSGRYVEPAPASDAGRGLSPAWTALTFGGSAARPLLTWRLRGLVALLVLLGHVLVLALFEAPRLPFAAEGDAQRSTTMAGRRGLPAANDGSAAMSVVFIERPRATTVASAQVHAEPTPRPADAMQVPPATAASSAAARDASSARIAATASDDPVLPRSPAASRSAPAGEGPISAIASPPRLFARDGAILLPRQSIDDLRRIDADDREFGFQQPGLAAGARQFQRRDELPYAATRFDQYHPQTTDILSGALRALADSMTFENTSGSVRCAMLSAEGGANCTFGGGAGVVELDDPDTLDAAESARCQALWDGIVAANTQDAWLALRKQYQAQCRKPPAEESGPPAVAADGVRR